MIAVARLELAVEVVRGMVRAGMGWWVLGSDGFLGMKGVWE
jgi:hypothetical protein